MKLISKQIAHVDFTGNIEYLSNHFNEINHHERISFSYSEKFNEQTYGFLLSYDYENNENYSSAGFSIIFIIAEANNEQEAQEYAKQIFNKDLKSTIDFLLSNQI